MRATVLLRNARVHKPSIQFLGKRNWQSEQHEAAPHPAAPQTLKDSFQSFLAKFKDSASGTTTSTSSSAPSSSQPGASSSDSKPKAKPEGHEDAFLEFWQMPKKYWGKRGLSEAEIEAVETGGASLTAS